MKQILQTISLFPECRLWRLQQKHPEVRHTCGGVATLLLIIIMGIIISYELNTVLQRSNIKVASSINAYSQFVLTNVSTPDTYLDPNQKPIMMGFELRGGLSIFSVLDGNNQAITLQPCTKTHFQDFIISGNLSANVFNQSQCLPLSQEYLMGGSRFDSSLKQLRLTISCLNSTCLNNSFIQVYVLSHQVNPHNRQGAWLPSLAAIQYYIQQNVTQQYQHQFILNNLVTNQGIFPTQNITTKSIGYQFSNTVNHKSYQSNTAKIILDFHTSQKVYNYQRSYYTMFDALSYVGGFFNAILILFFFMNAYGQLRYEILFAKIHFGTTKETQTLGFFSFIQQFTYNVLVALNYKPNWQMAAKRHEIGKRVRKLMNITYLHRRIQFLEKAITVLLDQHHIKGLQLSHKVTQKEVDLKYQQFCLRDKVICYLRRKQLRKQQEKKQQQHKQKEQIQAGDFFQIKLKTNTPIAQSAQNIRPIDQSLTKMKVSNSFQKNFIGSKVVKDDYSPQKIRMSMDLNIQDKQQINRRMQEVVDIFGDDQVLMPEVQWEIQNNLKLLIEDALSSKEDNRSRRVLQFIEQQFFFKLNDLRDSGRIEKYDQKI